LALSRFFFIAPSTTGIYTLSLHDALPILAGVSRVTGGPALEPLRPSPAQVVLLRTASGRPAAVEELVGRGRVVTLADPLPLCNGDRKSTRLNSSHRTISYAVFCLKKKKKS